jgi:tRNA (cytidine/uridine-2'-O-)-methyltransferase
MKQMRTLKKLRRRGQNTARGWLALAIKTYARTLESSHPQVSRDELHLQLLAFTRQILQSVESTPRCSEPVSQILDATLQMLNKELGVPSPEREIALQRRLTASHTSAEAEPDDDNFKGLTPLEKLLPRPPLPLLPPLLRTEDGSLSATTAEALRDFHPEIVLFSPQIPPNTGTIARLCAAFSCRLHLIEPLGFDVSEKSFRRAGLDYWPFVELYVHSNWESFLTTRPARRLVFVETGGQNSPSNFSYCPGDLLIFGSETTGIPRHILSTCKESQRGHLVTIPMFDRGVRSLNLANSVSIVAHCALANLHANFSGA